MRWEFGRRSDNVEDRRGSRMGAPVIGGGIGAVVLALIVALLGGDPTAILEQAGSSQGNFPETRQPAGPGGDRAKEFVSTVLASTEDTWSAIFRQMDREYVEPRLVLFSGAVESACGYAEAAVGPFYCPRDQRVYIDLSFYQQLSDRLNAPGDFAQAYVIAHEVGHHVQNLLGISGQVQSLQQRVSQPQANELSVRLELQADCFAGVWGYYADQAKVLEPGDIEEALNAATAIGDDRLQQQSRGYVVPDSFTHGSSAQRVRWFQRGIQSGNPEACDTFGTDNL